MAKLSDLKNASTETEKSKSMGLAEYSYKLSKDLERAKDNPALKALEQLENDRKSLLDNFLQYDSTTLDKKISELEAEANSPLIQSALNQTSFMDSILESIKIHDLDKLKESLGFDYKQYLKPELSATQKAIESLQQTISNPAIQNSLLDSSKISSYESEIERITKSIADNYNLFESSKGLAALSSEMARDSLKSQLEAQSEYDIPQLPEIDYRPIEIPENPMIGQNKQIIGLLKNLQLQNETLIKFEEFDRDNQKSIVILMENQQNQNEIMIEELKSQNSGIKDQLKELKKHNDNLEMQLSQKEIEIEENKDSNSFTRKIAIWGIGISIVVGIASSIIPFWISNVEMQDNNNDNEKVLNAINNKSIQNENMSQLIKEIQIQNNLNRNIEKNQLKIIKITEDQYKINSNIEQNQLTLIKTIKNQNIDTKINLLEKNNLEK